MLKAVLLFLLSAGTAVHAGMLSFHFDFPVLTISPGGHTTFHATVANPTADTVYLNADSLALFTNWAAAGLTVDDQFLANAPLTLAPFGSPGDSSYFVLLEVTASSTAVPGSYSTGQLEIQGGLDGSALDPLAAQNFAVQVVPEPSAAVPLAALVLAAFLRRRR